MPVKVTVKSRVPAFERDLRNRLRRNARATGRALRDEIRAAAPTSTRKKRRRVGQTGKRRRTLRQSIRHVVVSSQRQNQILIGVVAAFYGRFLETGTKDRVQKRSGRRTGRIDPRPFIVPSFTRFTSRIIEIMTKP